MHIVAIAWIYVVSMMAFTETSVIAGIMTFTLYCAVPLGSIWYFMNRRKHRSTDQPDLRGVYNELNLQLHDSNKSTDNLESETQNKH